MAPPETKTDSRRIVAYIEQELFQRVRVEAAIRDTSLTDIVAQSLVRFLEEEGHDPQSFFDTEEDQ